VEVAKRAGADDARLINCAGDVDWAWFEGVSVVGVTAGASAPENLVEDLVAAIAARFDARVEEVRVTDEDVVFKLPRVLAE
jgi:4-hydroxy-3-methylbut-2-enyl diphosphate reductase